ncbi:hypothetical protein BKA62DRAFT_461296 [Auriculariales sp. MPI-PUGE-AT-0066]|nr:hypothetical protein BKA62DRAFT_461296 [Auriculariales sp. MPI-PUGE-AT-0066]
MTIRLRFAMHGVRNNRILHLVAIDQRKRRNARPLELLGVYQHRIQQNAPQPVKRMNWAVDRIKFWLDHGALPSDAVSRVLEVGGIIKRTAVELEEFTKQELLDKERLAEEQKDAARRRREEEAAQTVADADPEAPLRKFMTSVKEWQDRQAEEIAEDNQGNRSERYPRGWQQATRDPLIIRESIEDAQLYNQSDDGSNQSLRRKPSNEQFYNQFDRGSGQSFQRKPSNERFYNQFDHGSNQSWRRTPSNGESMFATTSNAMLDVTRDDPQSASRRR